MSDLELERNVSTILSKELDTLLVRYLILLDRYERLRNETGRHLANGFMSLSAANFTSPNRTRYGQDFYGKLMTASLLGRFQDRQGYADGSRPGHSDFSLAPAVQLQLSKKTSDSPSPAAQITEKGRRIVTKASKVDGSMQSDSRARYAATSRASPPHEPSEKGPSTHLERKLAGEAVDSSVQIMAKEKYRGTDPIRQFGILVPPALRAAQRVFRDLATPALIELVNVQREMYELETTVGWQRQRMLKVTSRSYES